MGTTYVPTYTNIFMSEIEKRFIYTPIKCKSTSNLHFIDNVFMEWTKLENQFQRKKRYMKKIKIIIS